MLTHTNTHNDNIYIPSNNFCSLQDQSFQFSRSYFCVCINLKFSSVCWNMELHLTVINSIEFWMKRATFSWVKLEKLQLCSSASVESLSVWVVSCLRPDSEKGGRRGSVRSAQPSCFIHKLCFPNQFFRCSFLLVVLEWSGCDRGTANVIMQQAAKYFTQMELRPSY